MTRNNHLNPNILFSTITIISLFPTMMSSQLLLPETISDRATNDTESINLASIDYGRLIEVTPLAVFNPTSINDIKNLILHANNNSFVYGVAARGQGHSVRGQAMVEDGIVLNMTCLMNQKNNGYFGINVVVSSETSDLGTKKEIIFADVSGEQRWIDVLNETMKHGLTPVSWTDYLYLSVGGTLSNAGFSGQTFRFGPQINNVFELDVITGKGDLVTCSADNAPELFYSVLGGLGQFGIITRARIALASAPYRVKWVRMLYNNFSAFATDQEHLILMHGRLDKDGVDYLEGSILLQQGPLDLSFYPLLSQPNITSLVNQSGIVYCIELAKYYYDPATPTILDKDFDFLLKGLSFVPEFVFEKEVGYVEFLDRVHNEELTLRSLGLWEVPHPWLNLFVPKSQISDFDSGVFKDILLKQKVPAGLILIYPMNRNKWDDKMSAVIPDEEVFYAVALLHTSGFEDWKRFDNINNDILKFCKNAGIKIKQYLPHYETREDWINHFGPKWDNFQKMKDLFDPNKVLSPGQNIFSSTTSTSTSTSANNDSTSTNLLAKRKTVEIFKENKEKKKAASPYFTRKVLV